MRIVLRPHLKIRLTERLVPGAYPKKIVTSPDSKYFDTFTNHLIAIKNLDYGGTVRPMVVAYDIIGSIIQVITVYPITDREIQNRLMRGRWIQDESR